MYGLASTRDGKIRYIGQTAMLLCKRFGDHMCNARKMERSHLYNWIRSELAQGFKIFPFVIEKDAEYDTAETRLIAFYKRIGADLVNQKEGGAGSIGWKHTPKTIAFLSARLKGKKQVVSAERRKKLIELLKNKVHSNPSVRAKISAAHMGKKLSQESIAKRTATRRANGFGWNAEQRVRRAEQMRRIWADRRAAA